MNKPSRWSWVAPVLLMACRGAPSPHTETSGAASAKSGTAPFADAADAGTPSEQTANGSGVIGKEQVQAILQRLHSPDEETRNAALAELRGSQFEGEKAKHKPTLTMDAGIELLRAAASAFPSKGSASEVLGGIPGWLVAIAAGDPRPEYRPIVEEIFPKLSPSVRSRALELLSMIGDTASAEAYVRLLRQYAGEIQPPLMIGLQRRPHHPDVFFPALLELSERDDMADAVYLTTLSFCQKGLVSPERIAGRTSSLVTQFHTVRDALLSKQQNKGVAWMWEEGYTAHRARASLLLDLFGYLPTNAVDAELVRSLKFRDPRLVYFAVTSLLRHGKSVPREAIELVAASAEMRNWLYGALSENHKLDLFPRRFKTQAAFAESEMVSWLVYPTELGRVPDEIVLGKVVSVDSGGPDGILDVYVYRFRTTGSHRAAKDGWMAGVAGPFLRKDAPNPKAYGGTFSAFEKWESKSADEHAGDMRELLDDWAKRAETEGR